MSNEEQHDLALTAAKYFIDSNMSQYANDKNGYDKLVSDLLTKYIDAKQNITKSLPYYK